MEFIKPNFEPFPVLKTERLILRRILEEDVSEVYRMRSDLNVMKFIGRDPAKTIDDAFDLLRKWNESIETQSGITWAISLIEKPQKLIGTMGLWRLMPEHFRAEVGYMLLPEYWRSGITKEALLAALNFGFANLGLHSVEAHIHPQNSGSAILLEHTGFIKEAHFRESFFYNGVFEDSVVYSLLAPKNESSII